MPVEWREEHGLAFLSADFRDESVDECFATLAEQVRVIGTSPPGQRMLIHVDPNHLPDRRFLADVKVAIHDVFAPSGARVAVLGVAGIGQSIVRGLNAVTGTLGAPMFPSWEKALAYLARG